MGERLPSPGSIIQRDYRDLQTPTPHRSETLRLLQWNIERGYKLPGIIEELKQIDADVIALQEVDIGCERSGSLDTGNLWVWRGCVLGLPCQGGLVSKFPINLHPKTGNEIAKALGLNYAFFCEFEELRSPLRTPELQVLVRVRVGMDELVCTGSSRRSGIPSAILSQRLCRVEGSMAMPYSPSLTF